MLYISWVGFPVHNQLSIMTYAFSWMPIISSKDQEANLVAGEKNPLPELRRLRDRATFGISFVMESGMTKTLIPFDFDKEAISYMKSYLDNY